jgi:hypothetical protein
MTDLQKLDPMSLVETRKDIYNMKRTLEDLKVRERELASQYPESVAVDISNHAIVQFCDRFDPPGFNMAALRLMILEYVSKAKLIKERMGNDSKVEYFYEYSIDDSTLVFLVKNGTLVTVWLKDGPDV